MTIREKIQAREEERANRYKNALNLYRLKLAGIVISAVIGLVQIVIALLK